MYLEFVLCYNQLHERSEGHVVITSRFYHLFVCSPLDRNVLEIFMVLRFFELYCKISVFSALKHLFCIID